VLAARAGGEVPANKQLAVFGLAGLGQSGTEGHYIAVLKLADLLDVTNIYTNVLRKNLCSDNVLVKVCQCSTNIETSPVRRNVTSLLQRRINIAQSTLVSY
jgi:hypothetical protein